MPWPAFVAEWCHGVEPLVTREQMIRAHEAHERLRPDYLDDLEYSGTRGLLYVHEASGLGNVLADCEPLEGFGPVFQRVRNGERGALSELIFATASVGLAMSPSLSRRWGYTAVAGVVSPVPLGLVAMVILGQSGRLSPQPV